MFIRKARAGSAGTYTWPHDGAVVEVPDALGAELLAIGDGGFTEVRGGQGGVVDVGDAQLSPRIVELIRTEVAAEVARVLGAPSADLAPVVPGGVPDPNERGTRNDAAGVEAVPAPASSVPPPPPPSSGTAKRPPTGTGRR